MKHKQPGPAPLYPKGLPLFIMKGSHEHEHEYLVYWVNTLDEIQPVTFCSLNSAIHIVDTHNKKLHQ